MSGQEQEQAAAEPPEKNLYDVELIGSIFITFTEIEADSYEDAQAQAIASARAASIFDWDDDVSGIEISNITKDAA